MLFLKAKFVHPDLEVCFWVDICDAVDLDGRELGLIITEMLYTIMSTLIESVLCYSHDSNLTEVPCLILAWL